MTTSSVYNNQALLKQVVANSYSLGECLRKLGLSFTGNSRVKLKAVITEYAIATDHFKPNGRSAEVKAAAAKPLAAHLVLGSSISSYALKLKLWNAKLLPRTCQECGQGELWNAQRLVLQLDHVKGNRRDNRLENLRIVCPNCHTQTHTFAGRGKASRPRVPRERAPEKAHVSRDKVEWPDNKRLLELVWTYPLSKLAVKLGISDTAIRKRCKRLGLALPPFGHWQRVFASNSAAD